MPLSTSWFCEGCGDCSVESNCLSVEPLETEFGRKRKINLNSCNKDFSCLNGFCPSFVTVEGATRRKKAGLQIDLPALLRDLPAPDLPPLDDPFDLLVGGVGGTGVVTVGALITMAAHLEGKGSSVLDFTGFAQKFGTVIGYVRIGEAPDAINQVRIETGSADAVIGCDAVVCSSPKASVHYRPGCKVVLNRAEMPTGDLVLQRDAQLRIDQREAMIRAAVGDACVTGFDANRLSEELMGDSVFSNIILLGAAWQRGMVPVGEAAMKQAIRLNGVAVEANTRAFELGRVIAANPGALSLAEDGPGDESAAQIIDRRAEFLTGYQNAAYADRYRRRLDRFGAALPADWREGGVKTAAKSLFKLMAMKDEYEVARLYTETGFLEKLKSEFKDGFKVRYHMAPPLLSWSRDARGRPRKRPFGPWMALALRCWPVCAGYVEAFSDPFRFSADRKLDRDLLVWFEDTLEQLEAVANPEEKDVCLQILARPMEIRGYGPVREEAAEKVRAEVAGLIGKLDRKDR